MPSAHSSLCGLRDFQHGVKGRVRARDHPVSGSISHVDRHPVAVENRQNDYGGPPGYGRGLEARRGCFCRYFGRCPYPCHRYLRSAFDPEVPDHGHNCAAARVPTFESAAQHLVADFYGEVERRRSDLCLRRLGAAAQTGARRWLLHWCLLRVVKDKSVDFALELGALYPDYFLRVSSDGWALPSQTPLTHTVQLRRPPLLMPTEAGPSQSGVHR